MGLARAAIARPVTAVDLDPALSSRKASEGSLYYVGSTMTGWESGDFVVRREVLGLSPIAPPASRPTWFGRPWLCVPVYVIDDRGGQLVSYIPSGAEFSFPEGDWPSPTRRHPWHGRKSWHGNGVLMIQKPEEHHAIWHFWEGPDRRFAGWYINVQTAFLRTSIGYDTQDLEVDFVVRPDGTGRLTDLDLLEDRVAEGRFSCELAAWIREYASDLAGRLEAGQRWWDPEWADWVPEERWSNPTLPTDRTPLP